MPKKVGRLPKKYVNAMYGSTLIDLLKNLDKTAFKRFRDFVHSPYFNNRESVTRLFEYIEPYYPEFQHGKLEKAKALRKLYAAGAPVERLNQDMSRLAVLCREFLAHEALKRNSLLERRLLLDAYQSQGMPEEFQALAQELLLELKTLPYTDTKLLTMAVEIQFDAFFHPATEKYKPNAPHLYGALDDLEQLYHLNKYRLTAEVLHRKRIYNEQDLRAPVVELAPVLDLYRRLMSILEAENPHPGFQSLLDDLEQHLDGMEGVDQRILLDRMYHTANRFYELGKFEYVSYLFRITWLADRYDLLAFQGVVTPVAFINHAAVAGMAQQLEWGRQFIGRYQD